MKLGKLQTVTLREVWKDEARDFTPWVSSDEGLDELGDLLGLSLELVGSERKVGPFSADVLIKDANDEDHLILVENQLEKTNHDHLGKLLTYAAGLGVKTVIWIASYFREEHRQAIDWLNENTTQAVGFFALEIELLKIDNSTPAPHLKIVAQPNEWTKQVRNANPETVSDTKIEQQEFWQEVKDYIEENYSQIRTQTPRPQHWLIISVGKAAAGISLTINSRESRAGCELYLSGKKAKDRFDKLFQSKESIESELGMNPEWMRLEEKTSCRIVVYKDLDYSDTLQRQNLIKWLADSTEKFYRVFSKRVKKL